MTFKIYTKTGDRGETALIGGIRVPKHHIRIECYGTVDELNSYIGLLKDVLQDHTKSSVLGEIQDRLFTIGSALATAPEAEGKKMPAVPGMSDEDVMLLEREIDRMDEVLPPLKSFILPGGTIAASHCHVARCICRRAERLVVHLDKESGVDERLIRYLNRLSDYLFVLARFIVHEARATEITWKPRI